MASIRSVLSISPSSKTAEVVTLLRSPRLLNKVLVIVEGGDDYKLYGKMLAPAKTLVHDLGGCLHFETILSELAGSLYEKRFFVIKDADFDILNGRSYTYSNLFLTDAHDAEMMIILQKNVDSLCSEYLKRIEPTLYQDTTKAIESLSYIKWYNDVYGRSGQKICFDNIKVDKIWNFDIPGCHAFIYLHIDNVRKTQINVTDVKRFALLNEHVDRKHLLNGHDMCNALMHQLRLIGRKNLRKKYVADYFRNSYTLDDFKTTNLYASIENWSMTNYKVSLFS